MPALEGCQHLLHSSKHVQGVGLSEELGERAVGERRAADVEGGDAGIRQSKERVHPGHEREGVGLVGSLGFSHLGVEILDMLLESCELRCQLLQGEGGIGVRSGARM